LISYLRLVALHPQQLSLLDAPPDEPEPERDERETRQRTTGRDTPAPRPRQRRTTTPVSEAVEPTGAALLTTHEAAAVLHVHPRTVQRLVERGELCAVHLGAAVRFDPDDVDALIERVKSARSTAAPASRSRARTRRSASFADRLRSRQHEHRAAHA
jgi:excisionase family DNA binding protein